MLLILQVWGHVHSDKPGQYHGRKPGAAIARQFTLQWRQINVKVSQISRMLTWQVFQTGLPQIVPGSQRSGRIEHKLHAGQQQADPERLEALVEHYGKCYAELQPGKQMEMLVVTRPFCFQNYSQITKWFAL